MFLSLMYNEYVLFENFLSFSKVKESNVVVVVMVSRVYVLTHLGFHGCIVDSASS